jgi:hypothetical protein
VLSRVGLWTADDADPASYPQLFKDEDSKAISNENSNSRATVNEVED